jgi:hypothetical protein
LAPPISTIDRPDASTGTAYCRIIETSTAVVYFLVNAAVAGTFL